MRSIIMCNFGKIDTVVITFRYFESLHFAIIIIPFWLFPTRGNRVPYDTYYDSHRIGNWGLSCCTMVFYRFSCHIFILNQQ